MDGFERGALFGRYVILERIGAGAMGVVYAAFDTHLSRRTALKVLRAGASGPSGEARLLREAQAMAQLQHPNVITVHDAGTADGQVYISMELVEGLTASEWVRAGKRSVRELLRVFLQAADGVAAAHRRGLVHRDLKPDNILVGRDGRVRVSDFGLARSAGGEAQPIDPNAVTIDESRPDTAPGTPAYMAPEQLQGLPADVRSDQFSFCVALYEALYRERPFAGATTYALYGAASRNEIRPAPPGSRVPARVRRALLRGLRADPRERWPGMDALAAELRREPPVTWRRLAIAASAGALIVLGALTLTLPARVCAGAAEQWGPTWNENQRVDARVAFERAAPPVAKFVFAEVDRALHDYRAAWTQERTEACRATRVRHEQPEAVLGVRARCLDARRDEAAALARLFINADRATVEHAAAAVAELQPVSACMRAQNVPAPAADPPRVERVRKALAEAKALDDAGRYPQALDAVASALDDARALGDKALLAELLLRLGNVDVALSRVEEARRTLHDAAIAAEEAHDDGAAADAWSLLSYLEGVQRERRDEGEQWNRYAAAAIVRLGGDDLREARRLTRLVNLLRSDDRRAGEIPDLFRRQRELLVRAGAPPLLVADADRQRALYEIDVGHVEEGARIAASALETRERILGPEHPQVGSSLVTTGVALTRLGRTREALAAYERATRILSSSDPGGLIEALARYRWAECLRQAGEFQRALDQDRRSLEIYEARAHEGDYAISWPLTGVGMDLVALRRPAEAIAPLERALALRTGNAGDPEELGRTKFALANALWDAKRDRPRALRLAEEARGALAFDAETYGAYHRTWLTEVESWLDQR